MDDQCLRHIAGNALTRRDCVGRWRWRGLCHVRRERVKWFPDRRGLAVGLTAAGYGAGAALTVIPIRYVIDNYGYNAAFLWFGIVQGAVVFVLALLSAAQGRAVGAQLLTEGSAALRRSHQTGGRYHHEHEVKQPEHRGVLALGNTWNGTVGLCALTWGEIFSLFPSTCTDTFGPKFATVNLSLLYTAKGTSAFLVPIANVVMSSTGSWHMVFVVTALMNFLGGRACLVCAQTAAAADARRRLNGVARFRAIAVISDGPCRSLPMDRL
jgi:hypothetical protein